MTRSRCCRPPASPPTPGDAGFIELAGGEPVDGATIDRFMKDEGRYKHYEYERNPSPD